MIPNFFVNPKEKEERKVGVISDSHYIVYETIFSY